MQDIVLRHNKFKDNDNDLVVCAGSELLFEGNEFTKDSPFTTERITTFDKNRFVGGQVHYMTVTGVPSCETTIMRNAPSQ